MTTKGISRQGEGSAGGVCRPQRPTAERWVAQRMLPEECARMTVELHRAPDGRTYLVRFELSNPHTRELFGLILDPAMPWLTPAQAAEHAAETLRQGILWAFDPDPF